MHLWLGWAAALPLLVVTTTGVLLSFEEEFYRWEQPEHYALTPQPDRLGLPGVLVLLKDAGLHINHLEVPHGPERAYLAFASETSADGVRRGLRAYVNPYDRKIAREYENATFIRKIEVWHRTLGAGPVGRWIVAASSLALGVVAIAGLVLWWRMRAGTLRRLLRRGSGLDWHNVLGLAAFTPLVILAFTGITFTWGQLAFPVLDRWTGRASMPDIPNIAVPPDATASRRSLAQVAESVMRSFPNWEIRGVQDARRQDAPYKFFLRSPGAIHPGGSLQVFFDPYTGREAGRWDSSVSGPVAWYRRYFYIAHTGHGFPWWVRTGWAGLSAAGAVLVASGCWISIRRWTKGLKQHSPTQKPTDCPILSDTGLR